MMAEMLVRIKDKITEDTKEDWNKGLTKAGDVIVVRPDGWSWGSAELTSPEWAIIKVPDMSLGEAVSLIVHEVHWKQLPEGTPFRKRGYKIELFTDGKSREYYEKSKYTRETVMAAVVVKTEAAIIDPKFVIGL